MNGAAGSAGRPVFRHLADCLGLAWRSGPALTLLQGAAALLAGILPITVAWLLKLVLDELAARTPGVGRLTTIVAVLAGVGVVAAVLPHLHNYALNEIDRRVSRSMRQRLFGVVNRMTGLGRLEDPVFHDGLQVAQRASFSGPRQTLQALTALGQSLVTLLGFVTALAVLNAWMVTVVLLAAVPTIGVELVLNRLRAATTWQLGQPERRDIFYQNLMSGLAAAKEIRLFALGRFFTGRMMNELDNLHRERRRLDRRELASHVWLSALGGVISGVGLLWAARLAMTGRFTVGDVSVFVTALAGVHAALNTTAVQLGNLYEALLLFKHYDRVVHTPPDLPAATTPRAAPPLRRGIEFRDVWFRYSDGHPWTLQGVNLWIPANSTLAVVGPNGAGKSTLIKLLCRFYDPTRGAVLWDGVDLRELDVESLRRRLGAVFQDFMEYDLTAAENIAVGELDALHDPLRVEEAARAAGVHHDLVALPRGYRTALTRLFFSQNDKEDPETGVVLSGGQWQRVALARALLRDSPDLLILDEPNARLDPQAEADIHHRLRRHRNGRTSVLISHRLNMVREADRIVVLSGGRVREQGSHTELLGSDGLYRHLFGLQSRGYQTDGSPERVDPPGGEVTPTEVAPAEDGRVGAVAGRDGAADH